jgi:hypothetical protein
MASVRLGEQAWPSPYAAQERLGVRAGSTPPRANLVKPRRHAQRKPFRR